MKYCDQCGEKLEDDAGFCSCCGEPSPLLEEDAKRLDNPIESAEDDAYAPKHNNDPASARINFLCLILLIGCEILWFTAPFVAINLLTLGDQPTALQLIQGDVLYIGELSEAPQAWAALISIIGIIICIISTIAAANKVTRTTAIITELPMILVLGTMIDWADDAEELMEALGPGFWGIFVLLLIVAVVIGVNPAESEK